MQYTTDLKKMSTFSFQKTVRSIFPNFVAYYSPLYQPHRELLSPEQSNPLLQLGLYFWRWFSCFLKLLEEILICFEEELWILTSRCLFSFALCLWFFSLEFFLICQGRKDLNVNALFWASGDNLALKRPANSCKQVAFAAGVQKKPKRCRVLKVANRPQIWFK